MSDHSASPRLLGLPWQALAIAAVGVALLLLLSPAYGWHRDELYFVVAGRHPALGYVDQPPLTPLLSAGMVALLGPSPTAVRIVPALVLGAIVVLAGLIARVVSAAAAVEPTAIRTLDAIHLASAALLGEDLEAIVPTTCDWQRQPPRSASPRLLPEADRHGDRALTAGAGRVSR